MRLSVAAAVMIGFCGTAFAGCPVADIEKTLNLPLDGLSMSEQDVEDIQSTEGGSNGTLKRTTGYFYFCGGKLHVPPEQFATVDVKEYAKAGEEARGLMLGSKEIAEATKGLKR